MTAKLALVLLAALTARGAHHHERHELGPYVRAEQLAERTILAAQSRRVPVALYASLLLGESDYDAAAVNRRTRAAGMAQLLPGTTWFAAWRADCRLAPESCEVAGLMAGARALRWALDVCRGDRMCAVARYRGSSKIRRIDRAVVTRAWRWKQTLRDTDEQTARAGLDVLEANRQLVKLAEVGR